MSVRAPGACVVAHSKCFAEDQKLENGDGKRLTSGTCRLLMRQTACTLPLSRRCLRCGDWGRGGIQQRVPWHRFTHLRRLSRPGQRKAQIAALFNHVNYEALPRSSFAPRLSMQEMSIALAPGVLAGSGGDGSQLCCRKWIKCDRSFL